MLEKPAPVVKEVQVDGVAKWGEEANAKWCEEEKRRLKVAKRAAKEAAATAGEEKAQKEEAPPAVPAREGKLTYMEEKRKLRREEKAAATAGEERAPKEEAPPAVPAGAKVAKVANVAKVAEVAKVAKVPSSAQKAAKVARRLRNKHAKNLAKEGETAAPAETAAAEAEKPKAKKLVEVAATDTEEPETNKNAEAAAAEAENPKTKTLKLKKKVAQQAAKIVALQAAASAAAAAAHSVVEEAKPAGATKTAETKKLQKEKKSFIAAKMEIQRDKREKRARDEDEVDGTPKTKKSKTVSDGPFDDKKGGDAKGVEKEQHGKGQGKSKGAKGGLVRDDENTIYIKGLPFSVTEEALRKTFAGCGDIERLNLPMNEEGKPKGICFIKYKTEVGVDAALQLDNTDLGGRTINVCKAGDRGKGKDPKGKGKDGKGKDGKGKDGKGKGGKGKDAKGKDGKCSGKAKGKKDYAPSTSFSKYSGALQESTGLKTTFADDSDDG